VGSAGLDLDDIQGNVVPGFSKDHQAFVFVRFRGADAGRKWLAATRPHIASARVVDQYRSLFQSLRAREPHPHQADTGALPHLTATWVNVVLSFAGLRWTAHANALARFSAAFRTNRIPGADPTAVAEQVHALLIVAADQVGDLETELAKQRLTMASVGVDAVLTLRGDTLPGALRGHEHFGFKDAISQPRIAGTPWGIGLPIAPGEFVLGYPDQTGQPSGTELPAWTQNGSFVAFVKLQQHVATFWSAMKQAAGEFGVQPDEVAGWIVGRERDARGTQLNDPPARVSHIGRAYSRWVADAQRHRVIRRGIPYGPPLPDGQPDDGVDRGLFFVTYQADLERQFEHVWKVWLNGPDAAVLAGGRDVLVGQPPPDGRPDLSDGFGSPGVWSANQLRPGLAAKPGPKGGVVNLRLPAFVTPRVGSYFFAPSLGALETLAGL
jgi:Dyp-type peroxidase family